MDRTDELIKLNPEFSIIVAVHNDWIVLDTGLASWTQEKELRFESSLSTMEATIH